MKTSLDMLKETAKKVMLTYGKHQPCLLLDGTKGSFYVGVEMPDPDADRAYYFYQLAQHIPQNRRRKAIGELEQIAFIAEAWGLKRLKTEPMPTTRPSLSPDRIEMLIVSILDLATRQIRYVDYETLRTPGGAVHDLLQLSEATSGVDGYQLKSALLEGFVQGWYGKPYTPPEMTLESLEQEGGSMP